ncbi:MAG TPA: hypothetical protein PKK00_11200 [Bacteroidales bacterium]|nr:hypothetical protein [Bacteroidales bacterium]HPS17894.1 hypothetical protein [Bacteroidales bacterium]
MVNKEQGIIINCGYMANQEEHHKNISFQQEYDKFFRRYGFDIETLILSFG